VESCSPLWHLPLFKGWTAPLEGSRPFPIEGVATK
jgi:hypothetical protein